MYSLSLLIILKDDNIIVSEICQTNTRHETKEQGIEKKKALVIAVETNQILKIKVHNQKKYYYLVCWK